MNMAPPQDRSQVPGTKTTSAPPMLSDGDASGAKNKKRKAADKGLNGSNDPEIIELTKKVKTQQEEARERQQRLQEDRKLKRRAKISSEVGHEVNSDEEREYLEKRRQTLKENREAAKARRAAEDARRAALSPNERRQEDVDSQARHFRNFIKPQVLPGATQPSDVQHYPLFLLQEAPKSSRGATCRFRLCDDRINPYEYRIAVSPGENNDWDAPSESNSFPSFGLQTPF